MVNPNCFSNKKDYDVIESQRIHKRIEKKLKEEKRLYFKEIKLLLLGKGHFPGVPLRRGGRG